MYIRNYGKKIEVERVEMVRFKRGYNKLTLDDTGYILYTGEVEVWTRKKVLDVFHAGSVRAISFSPDGKYIASGGADGIVRLVEISSGNEIIKIKHDGRIFSISFSPDGRYMASGSKDTTVKVLDVDKKKIITLQHDDWVKEVLFSPDGNYIAARCGNGTVKVWKTCSQESVLTVNKPDYVLAISISPDGKYLATGSTDGYARIHEIATGEEIATFQHGSWVNAVCFSPDGRYLVTGGTDGEVRIWDISINMESGKLSFREVVYEIIFSPDGKYMGVRHHYGGSVVNARSMEEILNSTHDSNVEAIGFSPDGKYFVTAGGDRYVRIKEIATGKRFTDFPCRDIPFAISFSPDGNYLATGNSRGATTIWNLSTVQKIATVGDGSDYICSCISPNGKIVAIFYEKETQIWDASTKKKLTSYYPVDSLCFSEDGRFILINDGEEILDTFSAKRIQRNDTKEYFIIREKNDKEVLAELTWLLWQIDFAEKPVVEEHENFATVRNFNVVWIRGKNIQKHYMDINELIISGDLIALVKQNDNVIVIDRNLNEHHAKGKVEIVKEGIIRVGETIYPEKTKHPGAEK